MSDSLPVFNAFNIRCAQNVSGPVIQRLFETIRLMRMNSQDCTYLKSTVHGVDGIIEEQIEQKTIGRVKGTHYLATVAEGSKNLTVDLVFDRRTLRNLTPVIRDFSHGLELTELPTYGQQLRTQA